jgi:propanol-preferring alcohol dehydrogenase
MKAMVLRRPGPAAGAPLRFEDVPFPPAREGEVRIRVLACGVCHTDLHAVEGDLTLPKLPLIPGHQIVGVVDSVGPGTRRFSPGQRVGVPWLYRACGHCAYCRDDRENLCPDALFTGYHVDGGYAEFVTAQESFVLAIPGDLNPSNAAPLLCAGIIGYRALRQAEVRPGDRVGLYGFGASAHIAIQIARFWRSEVFVFSRSEEHRRLALELGAAWAGSVEESPPAKIRSAVIFAPAGSLVPLALGHLDRGGTLALAGITMSEIPPLDYDRHLYQERTLRSVTAATRQDAEDLLDFALRIPLVTEIERFPLEEANAALLRMQQSRVRGAAVLEVAR